MSSFDEFMIGEAATLRAEIAALKKENSRLVEMAGDNYARIERDKLRGALSRAKPYIEAALYQGVPECGNHEVNREDLAVVEDALSMQVRSP